MMAWSPPRRGLLALRRGWSASRSRLFWLLAGLVVLALGGCHNPTGSTPQARPVSLSGPWEYRWGDSPRDARGRLAWAQPTGDAAAGSVPWQLSGESTRPAGRNGNQFLWLRTRLPGPAVVTPTLYFLIVEEIFEAYLDGEPLYRFGTLDGEGRDARRFLGNRTHMIPLPPDYAGKQLTLRIFSRDDVIGISGRVRLGTSAGIIATMIREDTSDAIVGVILCAVGLCAVLLFLRQRSQAAYLHYGCFAFSMGLWILCQMGCRNFLIDAPMAWLTVEIFALYAAVAFLLRFVVEIFGRGPLGLARFLSHLLFGFLILSALLVSAGIVTLVQPLVPFRVLLMLSILYTLVMMAVLSARGNVEARLFAVGFLISALFGVHDTLAVAGILPRREISFSQFGQAGFVLCLGLILARRFQHLHKNLEKAEQTLSEKVSQLEERNREVQQLNVDLRRQIEARSKDLAASILEASSSFSEIEVQILGAGFVIADLYKVVRLIGQGGMGSVYEVERTTDGRHLAAKVLSVKAGKQVLARFAREAQLLAKLKHPNLVTIQDVDMTQSHMAYIVMELVNGHSLAALSASYRNLAFARKVLLQIADALASVHSQGIVHRDLKPENVLILHADDLARLTVKLVDFGVSMMLDDKITQQPGEPGTSLNAASSWNGQHVAAGRALEDTAGDDKSLRPVPAAVTVNDAVRPSSPLRISSRPAELTQTGIIMGTPLYMAPELRLGAKHARPSSDMFSFGVLAYEIVAGQLPSEQPALLQIFRKDRPWFAPLTTRNPDVPAELAALIERCLDPEIENRPSAADFRAALQKGA